MMPQKYGGVVDANLRVYGLGALSVLGTSDSSADYVLANVRVADSSVFPFEFAAHVCSVHF